MILYSVLDKDDKSNEKYNNLKKSLKKIEKMKKGGKVNSLVDNELLNVFKYLNK